MRCLKTQIISFELCYNSICPLNLSGLHRKMLSCLRPLDCFSCRYVSNWSEGNKITFYVKSSFKKDFDLCDKILIHTRTWCQIVLTLYVAWDCVSFFMWDTLSVRRFALDGQILDSNNWYLLIWCRTDRWVLDESATVARWAQYHHYSHKSIVLLHCPKG